MRLHTSVWATLAIAVLVAGCTTPAKNVLVTPPATPAGEIVIRVATAANTNAYAAGKAAAEALKTQLGDTAPHLILMNECYDERRLKARVLRGVASVFPRKIIFGASSYGAFAQSGCLDADAVALVAIGGPGIAVSTALQTDLGVSRLTFEKHQAQIEERLHAAGERLMGTLSRGPRDRLLILVADAHSPKNGPLVEGVQKAVAKGFPIVGGSANKNAGQTYVYYQGMMYRDSVLGIMLSGDFKVALAGRMAKENAKVISTAKDGAAEAMKTLGVKPIGALAFNCAGRKGRLTNIGLELKAMQQALGADVPLYGCYCAGEIGPADLADKTPGVVSSGVGWHVMFALIGR